MKLPVYAQGKRDIIDQDGRHVCFANTTEYRDDIIKVINKHEELKKLLKDAQRYIRPKDPKYIEIKQALEK